MANSHPERPLSLEDELGLPDRLDDPLERAVINLVFTYGTLLDRTVTALKPFGITEQHYNILKILESAPEPLPVGQIRQRLLSRRSDLTRLLDKLDRLGWVVRTQSDGDRRRVAVALTADGRRSIAELDPVIARCRPTPGQLTADEADELCRLLDKLRADRP